MSNLEIKKTILNKIKEYDRILIFRHFRPDGDAVGSTKGLAAIIKATWPEKEVLHVNEDYATYLEFMGPENAPVPEEKFGDALGIILDTGEIVFFADVLLDDFRYFVTLFLCHFYF